MIVEKKQGQLSTAFFLPLFFIPFDSYMNMLPPDIDRAKTKMKCPVCKKKKRLFDTDLIDIIAKASPNANHARMWVKDVQDFQWTEWACKACVKSKKAIKADISKHTYIGSTEHYFYIDSQRKCTNCKKSYVFTASEQQFWYEIARLPTDATPEFCKTCRSENESKKNAQSALMDLLPQLNPEDPEIQRHVSDIVKAIGSEEKAAELLQNAKNSRPPESGSSN